jgi:hypothetical protein
VILEMPAIAGAPALRALAEATRQGWKNSWRVACQGRIHHGPQAVPQ